MSGSLLKELFSNLLRNSFQHSGCDKISITARENEDEITVLFEDDGKGIPDDLKEDVFKKGFKSGPGGGSGLGLNIAKTIAEAYGNGIEAKDSKLGGARFDIQLLKA